MRTATRGTAWTVAWLAVVVVPATRPAVQPPQPIREAVVVDSVPTPGTARGLTFAESDLWSIGAERDVLVKIDPETGAVVGSLGLDIAGTVTVSAYLPGKEPAGLAWDGRALWYADRQQSELRRLQLPARR